MQNKRENQFNAHIDRIVNRNTMGEVEQIY